jgi:hypothetical protein
MSMTVVTTGTVKAGRLEIRGRKALASKLKQMRDGEVLITIERAYATRSKAQNDYYHAVVVDRVAGNFSGRLGRRVTPKEAHELLKAQFLPHELARTGQNGSLMNGLVIGGSTAKLNKLQFIEYLETIIGWAAEKWDLYIPDPDPEWRAKAESEAA